MLNTPATAQQLYNKKDASLIYVIVVCSTMLLLYVDSIIMDTNSDQPFCDDSSMSVMPHRDYPIQKGDNSCLCL